MTSATEVLRRLLDERGVWWWQKKQHTCWKVGKDQGVEMWRAWEAPDGSLTLKVDYIYDFTPAQAIAATLGATDANPTQAESSGTCKLHDCEGSFSAVNRPVWRCDCGAFMTQYTDATTYHKPRFCPNCGRRIEQ